MKAENLIDAMEYIGDDLLEAADKWRTGRKIVVPWVRWASLAASVCLIAAGLFVWIRHYGSTETIGLPETGAFPEAEEEMFVETTQETGAAENDGAPLWQEEILTEVYPESVQYIRTNGYCTDVQYPVITLIRTGTELDAYYEANKDRYDLAHRETVYADSSIGFADACDRYDEAYFETKDLLMVLVEEGSGSVRHKIGALTQTKEGWVVDVIRIEPEIGTADMAQWHILIEVEKDLIDPGETIRAD